MPCLRQAGKLQINSNDECPNNQNRYLNFRISLLPFQLLEPWLSFDDWDLVIGY